MSELTAEIRADASPELIAILKAEGYNLRYVGATVETNGQAPVSPAPKAEVVAEVWTGVTGYESSRRFPVWTSSNKIRRHVAGICWCRKGNGARCKAVSKEFSTVEEFNTRPDAELIEDEVARTFSIVG